MRERRRIEHPLILGTGPQAEGDKLGRINEASEPRGLMGVERGPERPRCPVQELELPQSAVVAQSRGTSALV